MNYIVIIIGIIIFIAWIFDEISKTSDAKNTEKVFINQRNQKYPNRTINTNESLFDRNSDIIESFADNISANSYQRYYLDNLARDCINEICLAEGQMNIRPGYSYLYKWENDAPYEWKELSKQIKDIFSEKQQVLKDVEEKVAEINSSVQSLIDNKIQPLSVKKIEGRDGTGNLYISDIRNILTINKTSWTEKENNIISGKNCPEKFPKFKSEVSNEATRKLNNKISKYNNEIENDVELHKKNEAYFRLIRLGYSQKSKDSVTKRFDYVINDIDLPASIPQIWSIDFNPEEKILLVEIKLPDVVHNEIYKKARLKKGLTDKPLNRTEKKENIPQLHPSIILRTAYEIFRNDNKDIIKLLVVNGWVEYNDPATGKLTKTYTASIALEKAQITDIKLNKIKPLSAFDALNGKSAGSLIDIIPITPMLTLDRNDKRFVDTQDVLNKLGPETNLASMDWKEFESLIAELFDKEFAKEGAEVKVTRASKDRGVDAIAFDPDPIKGGKFVIQAKRYTNTVDVSAVRDLCAVVKKEGASRGILVTTSKYGADAYKFAQNEPVTLLNGPELLGLLEKHGYKFRINIKEAIRLNRETEEQNKK